MLRFLMEQHNLQLVDLPEIGGEQVMSEILSGQLALDIHQLRRLANWFNVPVDVFIDLFDIAEWLVMSPRGEDLLNRFAGGA